MRVQLPHNYDSIISVDNLLTAWRKFKRGKRNRGDVQRFELNLTSNIQSLHADLSGKRYRHGAYQAFNITDPKPRHIHKASVRDRVLHHAVYQKLYPFFDKTFVTDSFSCRQGKGTHKAVNRFCQLAGKVSRNNTKTCWVLKCDIKKFFASVDQGVLLYVLSTYIPNSNILWLLNQIVSSFHSTASGKGLPLGNLTSQLLVNIYMSEFDQYVKHRIRAKYYIRYADDFVLLSDDRYWLEQQMPIIEQFLTHVLLLSVHPNKVYITTLASGVDFLGWVHFPDHLVLRGATAKRMHRRLQAHATYETTQSYLGLLKHGNTKRLQAGVRRSYRLWLDRDNDMQI